MLGNRNSQHSFAQIPDIKIQRSKFDRSFAVKDTFDFDYLVPIFVDEVLPGDTASVNMNCFARLATQKVPIMDNLMVDYHFWFVPCRLVWNNWEKFNGAQTNPGDSTDFILPTAPTVANGPEVGTIYDKMGLPTDVPGIYHFQTLPFRAYNLIWNDWYRDQNMQNSLVVPVDDGPDALSDFSLQKRNKRHDYFTSALPSPQKGPAVELPLGSHAPVHGIGKATSAYGAGTVGRYETGRTGTVVYGSGETVIAGTTDTLYYVQQDPNNTGFPNIYADLSAATASTINQLREAFAMQALFELDMRGGTRYVEILRAHFNVVSPDFRLQRPEFLGGGSTKINSHPVAQTAPTSGTDAQAQLAAFGTTSTNGQTIGFSKSFVEHGYVIGLACARADLTYQQGLNKMWSRSTRYDFYWPKLALLGEQAIPTKEIYTVGAGGTDDTIFGYQERYAEYRYKPSEIHGEFRSTFATPLDYWHMAQKFTSAPTLNSTFISQATPIDRAIAVTDAPHLLFDAWFKYTHARPLPVYSVPASLGRM